MRKTGVDYIELYPENQQDGLGPMLQQLRKEGRIATPDYLPDLSPTSRFYISKHELDTAVNPAIAKLIKVERKMSRQLRLSELNAFVNLHSPGWNDGLQLEWMEDANGDTHDGVFTKNGYYFIGNGRSYSHTYSHSGLMRLSETSSNSRHCDVAFRPMITFPTQK